MVGGVVVADLVAGEVVRERRVLELSEIREETREQFSSLAAMLPKSSGWGVTHVVEASFLTTVRHLPVYARREREQRGVSASEEVGALPTRVKNGKGTGLEVTDMQVLVGRT